MEQERGGRAGACGPQVGTYPPDTPLACFSVPSNTMKAAVTPLRAKSLVDLFGFVVLLVLVLASSNILGDPGVGWHLRTGQWIFDNGAIPSSDPFLWGTEGRPWVSNQWLSDVMLWALYSVGGLSTISALTISLCVLPFVLLAPRWCSKLPLSAPALALGIFLCMGLAKIQWYVRPVVFSFVFFAVTYWRTQQACERGTFLKSDFLLMPALFALWANMHPAFPLGLLVVLLSLSELQQRRAVLQLAGLCGLATLINPYGWTLHLAAAGLVSSDFFMKLNVEWLSPDFHEAQFMPLLAVLFLVVSAPKTAQSSSRFERLTFAIFVVLALRACRYAPFLAFTAILPTTLSLQSHFNMLRRWSSNRSLRPFVEPAASDSLPTGLLTGILSLVICVYALVCNQFPERSIRELPLPPELSAQALAVLQSFPPHSKIFHTPNVGGFLTWSLWPTQRPWIDDRNEMSGQEIYEDFLTLSRAQPKWKEVLTKYKFDYLLLERNSAACSLMENLADWKSLYLDDTVCIFKPVSAL